MRPDTLQMSGEQHAQCTSTHAGCVAPSGVSIKVSISVIRWTTFPHIPPHPRQLDSTPVHTTTLYKHGGHPRMPALAHVWAHTHMHTWTRRTRMQHHRVHQDAATLWVLYSSYTAPVVISPAPYIVEHLQKRILRFVIFGSPSAGE